MGLRRRFGRFVSRGCGHVIIGYVGRHNHRTTDSLRSVPVEDGELLEGAGPEVAHVVNVVALEQFRDAAALSRARWNLQQQVAVPQRLVVGLQGYLVVAEPLKGSRDAASQPVVAGYARSGWLLPAHRTESPRLRHPPRPIRVLWRWRGSPTCQSAGPPR